MVVADWQTNVREEEKIEGESEEKEDIVGWQMERVQDEGLLHGQMENDPGPGSHVLA